MGAAARNLAAKVEEDCGGMLVGGNRRPERSITQVLQRVGEREIGRILRLPQPVTLGELGGTKRGKAQQVVAAKLDHVDAEVVAGEYLEVRANPVPQSQPIDLNQSIQAGVLHAHNLRNRHDSSRCFRGPYL